MIHVPGTKKKKKKKKKTQADQLFTDGSVNSAELRAKIDDGAYYGCCFVGASSQCGGDRCSDSG